MADDSSASFSGLASGVQWQDLVDQIIAAESAAVDFASRTTGLGVAGELRIAGSRIGIQAGDSLDDVARHFNDVSAATGVTASVLTTGSGTYRLILATRNTGTDGIDLVDGSAGVLRSLGLLDATVTVGGRGSEPQVIESEALEAGAGMPATANTKLTALGAQGAAAQAKAGDTLTITGTRGDGSGFVFDYTIGANDTLQSLVDRLFGLYQDEYGTVAGFGLSSTRMQDRIDTLENRLEQRRAALIERVTLVEQVISRAQSQGAWLESQVSQQSWARAATPAPAGRGGSP